MKWQPILVLLLVLTAPLMARAQCTKLDREATAHETQARGYWTDPCTGLTWAAKDSGKTLTWQNAKKYCHNLRLAGYSDWRLGTIYDLQGIYDKGVETPGINPASRWHGEEPMNYYVTGGLFLRGNEWSAPQKVKRQPIGQIPYWDFLNGSEMGVDTTFIFHLINFSGGIANALCVRSSSSR
jgi:hypothetical protein